MKPRQFNSATTSWGFSERDYFDGVWIVQELCGSRDRTIVLGAKYRIDWGALVELTWKLALIFHIWHDPLFENDCYYDGRIWSLWGFMSTKDDEKYPFPEYLRPLSRMNCKDGRDRIYGTVSLVD